MRFAKLVPTLFVVGLVVMACGGGGTATASPATIPSSLSISSFDVSMSALSTLKDLHGAGSGLVGVLLPDTTSSTRWVNSDLPYLTKAFQLAGYSASEFKIDNAQGNDATQIAQAQADITQGAKVLVVAQLDGPTATTIQAAAAAKGVKVIAYDRAIFTGTNTYYVSFDNVQVGKTANGATLVGDQVAPGWDNAKGQAIFQNQYTAHPEINATIEANDGLANAVVTVLKQNHVPANKVPTVGQDASLGGVENVLTGYQCGTVYKAIYLEAGDAVALATILRAGLTPPAALVNSTTSPQPGKPGTTQPASLLVPLWVDKTKVASTVVKDGFVDKAALCQAVTAAVCTAAGIS